MSDRKPRVSVQDLEAFCIEAMLNAGMRTEDARITADVLVTTDTWGVFTHGSIKLRPLLRQFSDGQMDVEAGPELIAQGPGFALYDGHHAMAMVSSVAAMRTAMIKAREMGIAHVGVINTGHFGAAGYYPVMAALEDLIGISMTNTEPVMAVSGSRSAVLGTNPISYAVPAHNEKPVFLDIATSVVAGSKIMAAQALGKAIPSGWLIDKEGVPTTDPTKYPAESVLMPMAGHKGYGIALMVELLTSVLLGGALPQDLPTYWSSDLNGRRVKQSHSFIAIDPSVFMPVDLFKKRVDTLIKDIRQALKAEGSSRIYLPGETEWEKRKEHLRDGIALPPDVVESLIGLARDFGMDPRRLYGRI